MYHLKIRLVNQSGSTLLLVIAVMMLLTVVGAKFVDIGIAEIKSAINYRDGIKALYLAEAGAKRAIVELSHNSNWKPVNSYHEGEGSYSLTITTGTPMIIESVGSVNKSFRKVVIKTTISGAGLPAPDITIHSWNYH